MSNVFKVKNGWGGELTDILDTWDCGKYFVVISLFCFHWGPCKWTYVSYEKHFKTHAQKNNNKNCKFNSYNFYINTDFGVVYFPQKYGKRNGAVIRRDRRKMGDIFNKKNIKKISVQLKINVIMEKYKNQLSC